MNDWQEDHIKYLPN